VHGNELEESQSFRSTRIVAQELARSGTQTVFVDGLTSSVDCKTKLFAVALNTDNQVAMLCVTEEFSAKCEE
jgi:hypothetical protein